MLAEKSHNLITQASMRKQLSAPEYLEKRKLERERRKSFENGIRGRLKKTSRKYTVPNSRSETSQEICDCAQVSAEKGTDYTCDKCYIDLCSDCEIEISNKTKSREEKCSCRNDDTELNSEKCPECDRYLHYIDAGSSEHLERKQSCCKCSDFKSSQESVGKEFTSTLNKTRGYHSSDNIVGYTDNSKSKEDLSDTNNSSCSNVRNIPKTCLKCAKIKENIAVTDSNSTIHSRKSRCSDLQKYRTDSLRSKSKDDPQRSKLSKIGTWRRKSEPGLQQNITAIISKKPLENNDTDRPLEPKGTEKIEFECRNCGSNRITRKSKNNDGSIISDPEIENRNRCSNMGSKQNIEIKMYNSKNIPKKISKLKKSRAKGVRIGNDTTAKFYADFSTDISTENILHISESNDSLNVSDRKDNRNTVPGIISKDEDIDEETYKKLIEKTDSFKKNELEKVKYLNKEKVINEGTEIEPEKPIECEMLPTSKIEESGEDIEQPLEQIISQLLMQNREFQKLLKKQQQRNTAQRRHQRLLKSHSTPDSVTISRNTEVSQIKPNYGRQLSENLDIAEEILEIPILSPPNEPEALSDDDDHIYETLRVLAKPDPKSEQATCKNQEIRMPRPHHESDYVYLSFNQLKSIDDEGIYDVPVKNTDKVDSVTLQKPTDYYVTVEQSPKLDNEIIVDNLYDNIIDVCRRQKITPSSAPGEYLPMNSDQQSPNTPEIWLSRQKEHFNVSRDRKSGSLPRSFQVVTSAQEESNLSTFKCKPNSNSKTYLNRDGKVLSIDRPFTIASDKSDISYDDVENYMSDGDILKFNKNGINKTNDQENAPNISQSTLELEEEIDRCYKNNFEEINLDTNKNENFLTVSQPNLNISATSSCEALAMEKTTENCPKDIETFHPEHKIYKPTSNMLSLKNVLSRFKNKNAKNPQSDIVEVNANDPSSPESAKSDPKSPTSNEKRSALNPRSYSKNLLQRFRNIIGDEHTDDNQNRPELLRKPSKSVDIECSDNVMKNEIKVVITSTDISPTASTIVYAINKDLLSKSVYETTTLTESQSEKNNLEELSHSCDNITQKAEPTFRPNYDKSISMVTNISSSAASSASPSKSNNSSYQSLNKLPIYMQGSKNLGARIAQSDYVDPMTLQSNLKIGFSNVNILINKNAVRPDSLFSNSSFVTSSSEGACQSENITKSSEKINNTLSTYTQNSSDSSVHMNSDESYYEKSFEKIEHITDEDVFRDSAVYSDDADESSIKDNHSTKKVTRLESIKRNSSFKAEHITVTNSKSESKTSLQTRLTVTASRVHQVQKVNDKEQRSQNISNIARPKLAPPVPVKPKIITNIPTTIIQKQHTQIKSLNKQTADLIKNKEESSSTESVNTKTIKRNTNFKQTILRSESTPEPPKSNIGQNDYNASVNHKKDNGESASALKTPTSNIQIKRLSFERTSLDSATRKLKTASTDPKRSSTEIPKLTTKSVLERRMEIESMSKTVKTNIAKKPSQIAKMKSVPPTSFQRSTSECSKRIAQSTSSIDSTNIPTREISINTEIREMTVCENEIKESWVKQVVNKFQ